MYTLKPLTYDLNALEPVISEKTVSLHHLVHEQNYLDKLNNLLKKNNYNYQYSMKKLIDHIDIFPLSDRDDILYNLGGVLNHELYFDSISPLGNNYPKGKMLEIINKNFDSFDNFKQEFIKTAGYLVGSGYTFLVLNKNNELEIVNFSNQDTPYSYGLRPILALDLWEHAYYLDYYNKRNEYINSFFTIIDFEKINNHYEQETSA